LQANLPLVSASCSPAQFCVSAIPAVLLTQPIPLLIIPLLDIFSSHVTSWVMSNKYLPGDIFVKSSILVVDLFLWQVVYNKLEARDALASASSRNEAVRSPFCYRLWILKPSIWILHLIDGQK
jgi:hypothetical protein